MTLDEARARVGVGVVYQPYPAARPENGHITSVNDYYVFVRFVGDRQAKACRAEDLEPLR